MCGAPAAFSGDDLKLVAAFACDEGLDDAVLFDGVHQFEEDFLAEHGARLQRGGDEFREADGLDALPLFDDGCWGDDGRGWASANECSESFAECRFHHRWEG